MVSVSRGFNRLKKLAKEIPPEKEIQQILFKLRDIDDHASDRAAAIVGSTFIEAALESAILSKLIPLDAKTERPELFDGDKNGPLSNFSSRIRIAYALGLFGSQTRDELLASRLSVTHSPTGR